MEVLDIGTGLNDFSGEGLYTAADKVNKNFADVQSSLDQINGATFNLTDDMVLEYIIPDKV